MKNSIKKFIIVLSFIFIPSISIAESMNTIGKKGKAEEVFNTLYDNLYLLRQGYERFDESINTFIHKVKV